MIQNSSIEALSKNLIDAQIMKRDCREYDHYVRDAFYLYQMAHCYNPQKVYVYDSFTGTRQLREVPCGNCYYCRFNKINEWVTRCYAHLHDFKNVYFITLTYKPYYNRTEDTNVFMLNKLSDALFHLDNENQNKRLCWSPCVLCKKHYQDFFKRLRRNTGYDDITYIISGEYGTDYGRPHFHAILFSNHTITRDDIRRAWSFALVHHPDGTVTPKTNQKVPYYWNREPNKDFYAYHPIGRVDFNDLVDNGTISNQNILVDGRPLSAHNCFAYVCKYIVKGSPNEKRLKMAYDSLLSIYLKYKYYDNLFAYPNMSSSQEVNYERDFTNFVLSRDVHVPSMDFVFKKTRNEFNFVPSVRPYGRTWLAISEPYFTYDFSFPTKYCDFVSEYGCLVSPSRGCPIGSLYVQTHLQEMVDGNFPKPKFQTQGYVVPKYFLNKVDSYLYSLRFRNSKGNAVKGCLASSERLFNFEHDDNVIISRCISNTKGLKVSELLNSSFAFSDIYTKERMYIKYWEFSKNNYSYRVYSYKYSRKLKKYQYFRSYTLQQFKNKYLNQYIRYEQKHKTQEAQYEQNQQYRKNAESILSELRIDYAVATKKPSIWKQFYSQKNLGVSPSVPDDLYNIRADELNFDNLCREAILHLEDNVKNHNNHLKLHKTTDNE